MPTLPTPPRSLLRRGLGLLRIVAGAAVAGYPGFDPLGARWLGQARAWEPFLRTERALGFGLVAVGLVELVLAREPAPPRELSPRVRGAIDAAVGVLVAVCGVAASLDWAHRGNPEESFRGYDYNTFALDAWAVDQSEWAVYVPDKRVFHARVLAALASGSELRHAAFVLGAVCIGLLPAAAYVLGRRAGGPYAAAWAAVLTFVFPVAWQFSGTTTCYPLFYLEIVALLTATVAWVQRPGWRLALLTGLLAGASTATQEKTTVLFGPVAGVAALLALPAFVRGVRRHGAGRVANLAAQIALILGLNEVIFAATKPPMPYTPFVSLVSNQRSEVHTALPWRWPVTKHPDLDDPAGLRRWLPRAWWNGTIESWVAAARTPPDSNSLRLATAPGAPPWSEQADTTLPPLEVRLRENLPSLKMNLGTNPIAGAVLLGGGTLASLLLARGRRRVASAVALGVLASLVPITLRFGEHYLPQAVPLAAVLLAVGVDHLVAFGFPGGWRWLGRALVAPLLAAYALSLWTGRPDAWRSGPPTFPPPAAVVHPDPGHYSGTLTAAAAWLATYPTPGALIDCTPAHMVLTLLDDRRITPNSSDQYCLERVQGARPGDVVIASGNREYGTPDVPRPAQLAAQGWAVVAAFDEGQQLPPDTVLTMSRTGVWVLVRSP